MCNLSWTPHSNLEKDNSLKTTPVLVVYFAKGEPRNVEYCKVFFVEMQYMGAQD